MLRSVRFAMLRSVSAHVGLLLVISYLTPSVVNCADDNDPLTAVVQQQAAELSVLKARLAVHDSRLAVLEQHTSFMVQLSSGSLIVPIGVLKFDSINFNDGNGYDPLTGMFMAPFSGVYIFGCQVFTAHTSERILADLKLNGNLVTRMSVHTYNNAEDSETSFINLKLTRGDRVWVEVADGGDVFGTVHTYFTGSLIYSLPN